MFLTENNLFLAIEKKIKTSYSGIAADYFLEAPTYNSTVPSVMHSDKTHKKRFRKQNYYSKIILNR